MVLPAALCRGGSALAAELADLELLVAALDFIYKLYAGATADGTPAASLVGMLGFQPFATMSLTHISLL